MNGHLLASCLRNTSTKNYEKLIILLKVTIENVRDVFEKCRQSICVLFIRRRQ